MNKAKKKQLEKRGWKVGSASEFLGLSPEEARSVERKLTFGRKKVGTLQSIIAVVQKGCRSEWHLLKA